MHGPCSALTEHGLHAEHCCGGRVQPEPCLVEVTCPGRQGLTGGVGTCGDGRVRGSREASLISTCLSKDLHWGAVRMWKGCRRGGRKEADLVPGTRGAFTAVLCCCCRRTVAQLPTQGLRVVVQSSASSPILVLEAAPWRVGALLPPKPVVRPGFLLNYQLQKVGHGTQHGPLVL